MMSEQIGILLIHGAGESTFKHQEKFIKKLHKQLSKRSIDKSQLKFQHVDWYAPTQNRQEALYQKYKSNHPKLKSNLLRKFILFLVGDMAVYQGSPNKPGDAYEKTHQMVHQSILSLQNQLHENSPLIVIASSLGTEIISNYIWDRQKQMSGDDWGRTPFERFETLVGLFMFGNNAPIFAPTANIADLQPITFPSPHLPEKFKKIAIWENIYDRNDPLGFPIECINENYAQCNVKDIQMNVGGLLTFWNILSHLRYWTSRKVIKRIAKYIDELTKT